MKRPPFDRDLPADASRSEAVDCPEQLLLEDYVSGELEAQAAAALARHLTECPHCRRQEFELRRLLALAARLPREIEPSRDLWPQIERRLAARDGEGGGRRRPARAFSRFAAPSWVPALAAAVLVLMAGWWLITSRLPTTPAPSAQEAPRVIAAHTEAAHTEAASDVRQLRADLEETRHRLAAAVEERRGELSPETVQVIDRNLAVITQAIEEIEDVLSRDPANFHLQQLLAMNYRREIELLRHIEQLPRNT